MRRSSLPEYGVPSAALNFVFTLQVWMQPRARIRDVVRSLASPVCDQNATHGVGVYGIGVVWLINQGC